MRRTSNGVYAVIAYELGLIVGHIGVNKYDLHKLLWEKLSPAASLPLKSSLLCRVEPIDGENIAIIRLSSDTRELFPDNWLFEQVECPIFSLNQKLIFSVRLCPLFRAHGNRERTPSDLPKWVDSLLARNGLRALEINVGKIENGYYAKSGHKATRHNTFVFDVEVEVANLAASKHAWLYGIGRRKSTGCGLLM